MSTKEDKDKQLAAAIVAEAAAAAAKVVSETAAAAAAVVGVDISYIKKDIAEIKQSIREMNNLYVTAVEFAPIKRLVYGMVGLLLSAVVVAILALVIKR